MTGLTLYFFVWCRSRDLNPDGFCPLPPQDSVSTRFHHFGICGKIRHHSFVIPHRFARNLSVSNRFVNIKRVLRQRLVVSGPLGEPAESTALFRGHLMSRLSTEGAILPSAELPGPEAPGWTPEQTAPPVSALGPFFALQAWRRLPSRNSLCGKPCRRG